MLPAIGAAAGFAFCPGVGKFAMYGAATGRGGGGGPKVTGRFTEPPGCAAPGAYEADIGPGA